MAAKMYSDKIFSRTTKSPEKKTKEGEGLGDCIIEKSHEISYLLLLKQKCVLVRNSKQESSMI
jgi:hypothetical protein